jgi:hypothetical protein
MAADGMNGWDLIAATRQRTINSGLSKLYTREQYKGSFPMELFGIDVTDEVYVAFGPPRIAAMLGTGRQTKVVFPILEGKVGIKGKPPVSLTGKNLEVVTSLAAIAAELQPPKDQGKAYDLILDLKDKQAVVSIAIPDQPAPLVVFLAETLKEVLSRLADKKRYTVASFTLGSVATDYPYVIPKEADFTFIRDDKNVDESTFAVLMRTSSPSKGNPTFAETMLPASSKAVTLLSNAVLMRDVVRPGVLDGLKDKLANREVAQQQIVLRDEGGLLHVRNTSKIGLNMDRSPEIDYLNCFVNTTNELRLEINVIAYATFLDIEVQVGAEVNHAFELTQEGGKQLIKLKQTAYDEHHSTSMDWWKWLLAVLGGLITTVIVAIIYAVVKSAVPSLDKSMFEFTTSVTWPYMKEFEIQKVSLPAAVQVLGDPKLLG